MGLPRILLSWSGGKDSAWALEVLRQRGEYEVVGLLTTINEKFRRVAIHGYREALLDEQAEAARLPGGRWISRFRVRMRSMRRGWRWCVRRR